MNAPSPALNKSLKKYLHSTMNKDQVAEQPGPIVCIIERDMLETLDLEKAIICLVH